MKIEFNILFLGRMLYRFIFLLVQNPIRQSLFITVFILFLTIYGTHSEIDSTSRYIALTN